MTDRTKPTIQHDQPCGCPECCRPHDPQPSSESSTRPDRPNLEDARALSRAIERELERRGILPARERLEESTRDLEPSSESTEGYIGGGMSASFRAEGPSFQTIPRDLPPDSGHRLPTRDEIMRSVNRLLAGFRNRGRR